MAAIAGVKVRPFNSVSYYYLPAYLQINADKTQL